MYVRYGLGLRLVLSAFANYVGGQIMSVKMNVVKNSLDDIIIPTATVKDQFALLHEAFDRIRVGHLSVNLPNSEFCFPLVEWLGMIIDCHGTRPAASKIDAITQIS